MANLEAIKQSNERTIPNEPGALIDALLEWNKTPEGQEALREIGELLSKI